VIQSSLADFNKRREKFLKELDPERSELFFARRLLLVEGDTEKLSYPAYAAKLKLDLDRAGVTIVEVGGKRNPSRTLPSSPPHFRSPSASSTTRTAPTSRASMRKPNTTEC
jgi:hypothetical protein